MSRVAVAATTFATAARQPERLPRSARRRLAAGSDELVVYRVLGRLDRARGMRNEAGAQSSRGRVQAANSRKPRSRHAESHGPERFPGDESCWSVGSQSVGEDEPSAARLGIDEPEHDQNSHEAIDERPAPGLRGVDFAAHRVGAQRDESAERAGLLGPRESSAGRAGAACESGVGEYPARDVNGLSRVRVPRVE